jgi:hypothetical protein
MHMTFAIKLSAVLVLVVGCGSKQGSASKPPEEAAKPAPMCAMMKDAQLAATDGEHDVTVTFTTQGDPTELRAHVHQMGAMHDRMAHGGMMGSGMGSGESGGMAGSGMGSGMMGGGMHHMAMVPSHAAVDDVDHGARVVLTPDDPAQLATLREQVHAHVDMMKSGHCPMMEEHDAHHAM